ncbi:MAG: hypothetical protein WA160_00170 [Pseudobdellovibrio sp.]
MNYTEMIHMIIGNHFGKHKPEWNFFTSQYQILLDSSSRALIKIILLSIGIQLLFFIPVLYWIFQNYQILQTLIPHKFDFSDNFEFEKKWIVFLVLSSIVASSVWNAFIWYNFYKFKIMTSRAAIDRAESRGEADDLRLAS